MSDIGVAAGLSRGAPGYFFGSKDDLYRAVLEAAFVDRQEASERAVGPIRMWCEGTGGLEELNEALTSAVDMYMEFLLARPAFVRLISWEELAGGERLKDAERKSDAISNAFGQVAKVSADRGLANFDPEDAVIVFIAMAYAPVSLQNTFLAGIQMDLTKPRDRRRLRELAVGRLIDLITRAA